MKIQRNLKIIFILIMVLIPSVCSAKTIKIDDVSYNLNIGESIEEETFSYVAVSDTLTLKNANLKTVYTEENLNIVLVGNNYFKSENANSIIGKNVTVSGDGSLNIEADFNGIAGDKITINNTTLNIKAGNFCLKVYSTDNKDLIVNNSNLTLASAYNIFNAYEGNLYLNNSNILVVEGYSLLDTNSNNIYLNNTRLTAKVTTVINRVARFVYVSGKSEIQVENARNSLMSKNYILGDNLKILGSVDGITYQAITESSRDKFVHIYYEDEEILLNEESLKQKEENLNEKEESLKQKETSLNEKEEFLKDKETNLGSKEENLSELASNLENLSDTLEEMKETLTKKELALKIEEEKLSKQEIDLKELNNSLEKKTKELENYQKSLELKEDNLNNKEEQLDDLVISLNEKEANLLEKEETLTKKEIALEKIEEELESKKSELNKQENSLNEKNGEEELIYDLENVFNDTKESLDFIENPKTLDSITNYIYILIISLSIGLIILITKRRCFNGIS